VIVVGRWFFDSSSTKANEGDVFTNPYIRGAGLRINSLHEGQQRQEDSDSPLLRPMTQVEGYRCDVSYGRKNPIETPKGLPPWNNKSSFILLQYDLASRQPRRLHQLISPRSLDSRVAVHVYSSSCTVRPSSWASKERFLLNTCHGATRV
jgi:hypothetical protein